MIVNKVLSFFRGKEVQKYFFNTSWMVGEKVITMGITFVVGIFVARYLGAENYGILSYALSLVSLFAITTHMGLSGLAVRELVNYPEEHAELMGTIFGLKAIGALAALIGYLFFVLTIDEIGSVEFWVLILVSGTILLNPFLVFEYWFQAKVKAKYSSLIWGSSTILSSALKMVLVFVGAHLVYFASISMIKVIVVVVLMLVFFKKVANLPLTKWRFHFLRAKNLLGQGWMIMLGAIFAMIYINIDKVMLRWMIDAEEVGIYSVAAKLSEVWYFIPHIIVASLFPKLLEFKKNDVELFKKRLQQLLDLLFGIALILAIIVSFLSGPVINILYGAEFEKAALILSIHIWAGIFIFMRAVFSKWILVEDAIAFSMITQGAGALVNIIMNIILIPLYGGLGAAIATIISYAMVSYFVLIFYKKTRPIFWMMSNSLILPLRKAYIILFKQ